MREGVIIMPHKTLRDRRIERQIIEHHRDVLLYGMILVGALLILLAILW